MINEEITSEQIPGLDKQIDNLQPLHQEHQSWQMTCRDPSTYIEKKPFFINSKFVAKILQSYHVYS